MARHLSGVEQLTAQIDAVRRELPEGVEAAIPGLPQKLADAAQYLRSARNDIQMNIQPPITVEHTTAVEDLTESIIDLLLMAPVQTALGRSVTVETLAGEGYAILGQANRYKYLAAHFFSPAVNKLRDARPSDGVAGEIDAVADKADEFKSAVVAYINKIYKEFVEASRA